MYNVIMSELRKCENCNVCCDRTVSGTVNGRDFGYGSPCHFLKDKKCSIYNHRPLMCQAFKCKWLIDDQFPKEFKPNLCGILVYPLSQNLLYGKKIKCYIINVKMYFNPYHKQKICLEKIIKWMKENNENWIIIQNQQTSNFGGSEEFLQWLKS